MDVTHLLPTQDLGHLIANYNRSRLAANWWEEYEL
jgi:hypothetical protein